MGLNDHRTRSRGSGEVIYVVRSFGASIHIAVMLVVVFVVVTVLFGRGRECLVVVVADETGVIARWKGDAFAASGSRTHTETIVGITICTASPGRHAKGEHGIELDERMIVPKSDRDREEY